jgi:hypothetical protein
VSVLTAEQLERELLARAAQVHAAHAALAETLLAFDAVDGWHGYGIRSLGHWADINLGLASRSAAHLFGAAARLGELPLLHAAFEDGSVSLEKVQLVASVATAATDEKFTTIARSASVAQLQRICSAYRKLDENASPEALRERNARRAVTSTVTDSGLVRIVALLEPDEAAIVLAAIDTRVEAAWRRDRGAEHDTPPTELSTRRADALVELATEGMLAGPDPVVRGERIEVRVHVDAEVLTGARDDGVCEIEGVGSVSPSIVHMLLCDAKVTTFTEQLHGIFNLGRTQRTPNRRQRRALRKRDGGCRYPGCAMRRFVDAHHVVPWDWNGPTDMDNLLQLCPKHHRLFHGHAYTIEALGDGKFTFRRPDGRVIAPPPLRARTGAGPPVPGNPRATEGGAPIHLGWTIDGLAS